jgi:predicted metal-dependent peptidase
MFRLSVIEDISIPTMQTDGIELRYSPEFIQELSLDLIETIEFHEILHIVLFHHLIMAEMELELDDKFDPILFNMAADYEVNWILHNMGRNLPENVLYDERFNGKLIAEIYRILESERENEKEDNQGDSNNNNSSDRDGANSSSGNGNSQSGNDASSPEFRASDSANNDATADSTKSNSGSSNIGQNSSEILNKFTGDLGQITAAKNKDGSKLTKDQISEKKRDLENEIISAWKFSNNQGNGNPIVDSIIERILTKHVPWYELVRDFFSAIENGDSNWNRFDKRHLTRGMYIPSVEKLEQGRICFMIDVSGSVSSKLVKEWELKLNEIILELPFLEILVIFFHHTAYRFEEYTTDDIPIKLYQRESGGTDYVPPFKLMNDLGFDPDCILVLTDMLCDSFPENPGIPVLWCAAYSEYSRNIATLDPPFGTIVELE